MKKMVLILLAGLLFLFTGCTILKNLRAGFSPTSEESFIKSFNDRVIKTSEGEFAIFSIRLTQDIYEDKLEGIIKNNTRRNYNNTVFTLKLSDGRYRNYKTSIGKDQEIKFSLLFEKEEGNNEDIKNVDFEFIDGEYRIDYDFLMLKPLVNKNLQYSDSTLDISFYIGTRDILFNIANKTQNPIKLNWDNFSFVDTESRAHRLIHSSVKLIDSEKQQTTTIIPPFASIQENVYSPDYIDRRGSDWIYNPLFPDNSFIKSSVVGKTFSFFMPIEINGVVKNYNFVFKIIGEK